MHRKYPTCRWVLLLAIAGIAIAACRGPRPPLTATGTVTCTANASAQIAPLQEKATALTPSTAVIVAALTQCHATALPNDAITGTLNVTEQSTDGVCGGGVGTVTGSGSISWVDPARALAPTEVTILKQADISTPALGFRETLSASGSFAGPSFADTYLIETSQVPSILAACNGKGPGFASITLTNTGGTAI
jgi:hypothetical protein